MKGSKTTLALTAEDLKILPRDQLVERWNHVVLHVKDIEDKLESAIVRSAQNHPKLDDTKLQSQIQEAVRRENALLLKLAMKEQERLDLLAQLRELKSISSVPSPQASSAILIDPAVNFLMLRMKQEVDCCREKLDQLQNDLNAWKFTTDSVTGKKLMARCRLLIQENQELGRQLSQGRFAELQCEVGLQQKLADHARAACDDANSIVGSLDEEIECLQGIIIAQQKEIKRCRRRITGLEEEVQQTRTLLKECQVSAPSGSSSSRYHDEAKVAAMRSRRSTSPTPNGREKRTRSEARADELSDGRYERS